MTVPAQTGLIGFAPQATKVGDGAFNPANYTWRRFRAPRVGFGTQELAEVFPAEVGGLPVPTGAFKRGQFVAGDTDVLLRVENIMGFLLYATMGSASSVTGQDAWGNANAAVRSHIFRFNPSIPYDQPWFAARRMVPGTTTAENFGETGYDCKMASARFIVPQSGLLATRFTFIGRRTHTLEPNPSWTWANTLEDTDTVPVSSHTLNVVRWGTNAPKMLGATIDCVNGLTTPVQEYIIGSPYPDDFISLTRAVQIRTVLKWENANQYREFLTGSPSGTAWTLDPFYSITSGPHFAFRAEMRAPEQIPGSSPALDYSIHFRANKVFWRPDGPPELVAGGMVQLPVMGTVIEPETGDYFQVILENASNGYLWV